MDLYSSDNETTSAEQGLDESNKETKSPLVMLSEVYDNTVAESMRLWKVGFVAAATGTILSFFLRALHLP
jgi:hypothetical protein